MNTFLDRSNKLLGDAKIASFKNKTVLLAGLGGVGGTAFEALVRSGFEKFVLFDFDNVDVTNLNRQILFNANDIGRNKLEVAVEVAKRINKNVQIKCFNTKVDLDTFANFSEKVDLVIDAIDYVPGKIALAKFATAKNIPFIMSLGMGNRIDPEQVMITKLNKTENDPLARKIRYECKISGLDLSKINVVFSKENPLLKDKEPASMMMVPSTAGLLIAKFAITTL